MNGYDVSEDIQQGLGQGKNHACILCPSEDKNGKRDEAGPLSVRKAFRGATVLVTGATGFVGAMVVEHLLRCCPDVDRIYLLMRSKHGSSPPDRLEKLLQKPLFQSVLGEAPQLREKLECVQGELTDPQDCGLAVCKVAELRERRGGRCVVLHCAAEIKFFSHIHSLLATNYNGTKHLLQLSASVGACVFVYVSTGYINTHLPPGSRVAEDYNQARMQQRHEATAAELLAMPARRAQRAAQKMMARGRYLNRYTLSKHMAEGLVLDAHCAGKLVASIVRPSLIGCCAKRPLPGYLGNKSGATAAAMAIGMGLGRHTAYHPARPLDLIPADCVSSTILAAAASCLQDQRPPAPGPPLVLHAASSGGAYRLTVREFVDTVISFCRENPPPIRLARRYVPVEEMYVGSSWKLQALSAWRGTQLRAMAAGLRLRGRSAQASALTAAWRAWRQLNVKDADFDLRFDTRNARALQARLTADDAAAFPVVWDPAGWEEWHAYLLIYMRGVKRHLLHRPAAPPAPESATAAPCRSSDGAAGGVGKAAQGVIDRRLHAERCRRCFNPAVRCSRDSAGDAAA